MIEIYLTEAECHSNLDHELRKWSDGIKLIISDITAPKYLQVRADFVGTSEALIEYIKGFKYNVGTILVIGDNQVIEEGQKARGRSLIIRRAPVYAEE